MAKLPIFTAAQELLNATFNTAIDVFNQFWKVSLMGGLFIEDNPEGNYQLDEVIVPAYTTAERVDLANPQEGELVANEDTKTLNLFLNNAWRKLDMELYDVVYTITVRDSGTLDPIPGATVTLDDVQVDTTNGSGQVVIPVLPIVGSANIEVVKSGYTTYSSTFSPTPTSFNVDLSP
jgi:hypothetical protein